MAWLNRVAPLFSPPIGILIPLLATFAWNGASLPAAEAPDPPMERLVLDDMEDVGDWYNGSPEETTVAASELHVKEGKTALLFANVVDHTKGEKNYPIGWPRSGKDLKKSGPTDWSAYDYFECWIYATTSRDALPKTPLGVGFYHSGPKRSTSFRLAEVRKDQWVKIQIPIAKIEPPNDIRRVQFNISESNYAHGDHVDFYIDDVVLTRFAHPVIGSMHARRRLIYTSDRHLSAEFELLGSRSPTDVTVGLEVGQGENAVASASTSLGDGPGEIEVDLSAGQSFAPGEAWMKLMLQDASGKILHRKEATFRVIEGPFE